MSGKGIWRALAPNADAIVLGIASVASAVWALELAVNETIRVAAWATSALLFAGMAVMAVPRWQLRHLALIPKERAELEDAYRKTLAQILGGAAFLLTGYLSWRGLVLSEQQQVTKAFAQAVGKLEDPKLPDKLGPIYALEWVAENSDHDLTRVADVLGALVRSRSEVRGDVRAGAADVGLRFELQACRHQTEADAPDSTLSAAVSTLAKIASRAARDASIGSGVDLSRSELRWLSFTNADFSHGYFVASSLRNTWLWRAVFDEARLDGAILTQTDSLNSASFRGASLNGADLRATCLREADMQGASLITARLEGADMRGVNLDPFPRDGRVASLLAATLVAENASDASEAEPDDVRRKKQDCTDSGQPWWAVPHDDAVVANLSSARLRGARLEGVNFHRVPLVDAKLSESHMQGAHLEGADLTRAQLDGADLRWAQLKLADLRESNLLSADLCWADISGADLRGAHGLVQAQLDLTCCSSATRLPPGVDGMACEQDCSTRTCPDEKAAGAE